METATTATADSLPRLTRRQALLLLGGALCLALGAWAASQYRLVREAAVPENAVGVMRFVKTSPYAAKFQAHLDDETARMFEDGLAVTQEPTLFAYEDASGMARWHLLEALNVPRRQAGWRLVPRSVDAYGWIGRERRVPFTLVLEHTRYRLQAGHRERGFNIVPEPARVLAPALLPTIAQATSYAVLSDEDPWAFFQESAFWKEDVGFSSLLKNLSRPIEIVVGSASGTVTEPAIVVLAGDVTRPVRFEDAETALRRLAGERDPLETPRILADNTTTTELTRSTEAIRHEKTPIVEGFLYRLIGPSGKTVLSAFQDGPRLWIAKDATSIQGLMMASVNAFDPKDDACLPSFRQPGFAFGPESGTTPFAIFGLKASIAHRPKLQTVTFRKDFEGLNLFTSCGYY